MAIYVVENNLIMKVDQFSWFSFGPSENQYIFNMKKTGFSLWFIQNVHGKITRHSFNLTEVYHYKLIVKSIFVAARIYL